MTQTPHQLKVESMSLNNWEIASPEKSSSGLNIFTNIFSQDKLYILCIHSFILSFISSVFVVPAMYQDQPCSSNEVIQRFFQIPWCLESREISSLMSETSAETQLPRFWYSLLGKKQNFSPSALWPQHKQSDQPLKFLPAAMFLRYGYTYSLHACIFHVLLSTTSLVNFPSPYCIRYYCYLINSL